MRKINLRKKIRQQVVPLKHLALYAEYIKQTTTRMDNIKHRLEFFQNEDADITNFSQTEVMAITAMKNVINVNLSDRLFILAMMQNALRIDYDEYQNYYADWSDAREDAFKNRRGDDVNRQHSSLQECMTAFDYKNIISIPIDTRYYVLSTIQRALNVYLHSYIEYCKRHGVEELRDQAENS